MGRRITLALLDVPIPIIMALALGGH